MLAISLARSVPSHSFGWRQRIRRALRLLQGVATGLTVLLVAMCGAPQGGGESHTGNFLLSCSNDEGCAGGSPQLAGLGCDCSFCTLACTDVASCVTQLSGLDDPTLFEHLTCRTRPPMCTRDGGDEGGISVCDVVCESDADCTRYGSGFVCVAGYCRHGAQFSSSGPPLKCPTGAVAVRGNPDGSVVDLCVDVFEVTVADYRGCVSAGACTAPTIGVGLVDGKEQYPIDRVGPDAANAYCEYAGKRLPTRGEWGWAAQNGGVMTVFPWGDTPPSSSDPVPRVCALTTTESCLVGSFKTGNSAAGLADLAGNLAELVLDGADYCAAGGSFESTNADLPPTVDSVGSTSCDLYTAPADNIGFRCVSTPLQSELR